MSDATSRSDWNDATPRAGWNDATPWPWNGSFDKLTEQLGYYLHVIPGTERPPYAYGWICPRCERVNAPWVEKCDCKPRDKAAEDGVVTTVWPEPCQTSSAGGTDNNIVWSDLNEDS